MNSKKEIIKNWLPRYTGIQLEEFGEYILLTNFKNYVNLFAEMTGAEIKGTTSAMPNSTANGITIINFGMGSANAATIMDLLGAISPKAVLFLGKCGGLKKKNKLGDIILPIAAIRGEGASDDYFPPEELEGALHRIDSSSSWSEKGMQGGGSSAMPTDDEHNYPEVRLACMRGGGRGGRLE